MKRNHITLLFGFALVILTGIASTAQVSDADHKAVAEVIGGKDWAGFSITPSAGMPDGKLSMIRELYISLAADNSISGRGYIKVNLGGRLYTCRTMISGRWNAPALTIHLDERVSDGDSLPGGMYWQNASENLTIYKDIDRPGMFVLKGTVSDGGKATYHQK